MLCSWKLSLTGTFDINKTWEFLDGFQLAKETVFEVLN